MPETNGNNCKIGKLILRTLDDLDGRTAAARQAHSLVSAIAQDLGGAGELTAATRQLVQRAAVLGAILEDWEAKFLAGEPIDFGAYLSAIDRQRRVLVTLGLERRQKDITPLDQYLRQRQRTHGLEDAEDAEVVE